MTQAQLDSLSGASRGDPHRTLALIVSKDDLQMIKRMIDATIFVPDENAPDKYRLNPDLERLASSPLDAVKDIAQEEKIVRENEASKEAARDPISEQQMSYEAMLDIAAARGRSQSQDRGRDR